MALEKITEAQMNANGVIAAPDVLNGTAAENKAIFDRMVRSVVAPAYNACVDAVNALQALDAGLKASEEQRTAAEVGRVDAEKDRVAAENDRVRAELERVAAELARVTAETNRENAEAKRENLETGYVAQAKKAAEDAKEAAKQAAAEGTMKKTVYDPQGKETDIFKYVDEHTGGGGSGVHIGPEPPTNGETVWIDTDEQEGSFYTAAQVNELLANKVSMKLVWSNENPASDFAKQTISIPLESGDAVYIEGCDNTGNTNYKAAMCPFLRVGERGRIVRMSRSWTNFAERVVTVYASSIDFDDAYLRNFASGSAAVANDNCIPTKIYVIKGVQA